jgi:hypothetical protein
MEALTSMQMPPRDESIHAALEVAGNAEGAIKMIQCLAMLAYHKIGADLLNSPHLAALLQKANTNANEDGISGPEPGEITETECVAEAGCKAHGGAHLPAIDETISQLAVSSNCEQSVSNLKEQLKIGTASSPVPLGPHRDTSFTWPSTSVETPPPQTSTPSLRSYIQPPATGDMNQHFVVPAKTALEVLERDGLRLPQQLTVSARDQIASSVYHYAKKRVQRYVSG